MVAGATRILGGQVEPQPERTAAGKQPFVSRRTLLAGVVALLVGLGGTLGVDRLLQHAAAAPPHATAQYLPSRITQPWAAPDFTLKDQAGQQRHAVLLARPGGRGHLHGSPMPVAVPDQRPGPQRGRGGPAPDVKPVLVVVSVAADRTPADVSTSSLTSPGDRAGTGCWETRPSCRLSWHRGRWRWTEPMSSTRRSLT